MTNRYKLPNRPVPFTYGPSSLGTPATPATYRPHGTPQYNPVLWRFNEKDTTQFGSRVCATSSSGALNITSQTISFVGKTASNGVGNRIKFAFTFGSMTGGAWGYNILGDDGNPLVLPERFVYNFRIASATNVRVGLGFWNNDPSSPWGYGLVNGFAGETLTETMRAEGPTVTGTADPWILPASTRGGVDPANSGTSPSSMGALVQYSMDNIQATASTPPYPFAFTRFSGNNQSTTQNQIQPYNTSIASFLGTSVNASWTNKTGILTPMILMRASTSPGTGSVELADMMFSAAPMDYSF
jgi:hypothetical protein